MNTPPSALLLLGPTASGKSRFALELACTHDAEIVSIDSAQVYRGLDIGSAKPDAADRARVPHHLIDIRDPGEPYSAAEFLHDAERAVREIRARGRLPLIVGGTMMYARALRQGLAELPSSDPALRAELEREGASQGWPALHARLRDVDPETAARLAPNDRQRIGRALEVFLLAGRPLSALLREPHRPPVAVRTVALMPGDRARLHRAIEARFDAMLERGFLDEVRALRARGDLLAGPHAGLPADLQAGLQAGLPAGLPALRSVGYRQAWEHLEHGTPPAQFRAAAIAATRQLAKRQMTWLRAMPDALTIDPFADDAFEKLEQEIARVR